MNVSPSVEVKPTIALDLHKEFTFADNTDTVKCCCWFRSTTIRPSDEIYVNSHHEIERFKRKGSEYESRIRANQHLADIVKHRFDDDPISQDEAFQALKARIDHDFEEGAITPEKLRIIIDAIYAVKNELSETPSNLDTSDS